MVKRRRICHCCRMSGTPLAIAILGAESTGKTSLSLSLSDAIRAQSGRSVPVLPEVLRAWCAEAGRTPRHDEQAAIASAQARQLDETLAVAPACNVVIADTTPLMTAIYSDLLFGDTTLYEAALAHQRRYALTVVCGLDLPWQADGIQRDGPHVRVPVDDAIRQALESAALPYQVVYGQGTDRCRNALNAIKNIADSPRTLCARGPFDPEKVGSEGAEAPAVSWRCERCGDATCERRLFRELLTAR
jgi:nicotinamide riboside kinase